MKKSAGSAGSARPTGIFAVVAQNVQNLLDRDFGKDRKGQEGRFRKRHRTVALSKIQRARKEGRVSLETIEDLAKIFKVDPFHLLLPELNVDDPQVAMVKSVVRKWQAVARELVATEER